MHICLPHVSCFLGTIADLQGARLVVSAIGTGHQLLVFALEREPCFQVVFLGGGIIQCSRDYRHNLVWNPERLVEFLRCCDHLIKGFPRVVRFSQDKLFDLQ